MKYIYALLLPVMLWACNTTPVQSTAKQEAIYHDLLPSSSEAYLIRVQVANDYQPGESCGYINQKGDTIIPLGKYSVCWSDTIRTFGIVWDEEQENFIGIDKAGKQLYEVYFYDNGPDWLSEGLFRIKRHGKIGYADEDGFIKIEPRFECADPFENGKARVALECELIPDGEYTLQQSDSWFYIDLEGNKIVN